MEGRFTQYGAVIACIDPDAYTAAEYNTKATESDSIDMSKWHEILVIVMTGTMGACGTVDVDIETSDDDSTWDTTLKSITQITAADKQALVSVRAEDLASTDRYVNIELTVGTATCDCGVIVLGLHPRHAPASDNDLASVSEITNG